MNSTIGISEREGNDPTRWTRIRGTFGPTVAGLLGGALSGLAMMPAMETLCRNVAATYAGYPSLQRPAIAGQWLPEWLHLPAILIGLAAPISTGAFVVWLVRPRDVWANLSAGLTAALACTLAAFVTCIGWPVVLALVVVPSISDLTLMGDSVRLPATSAANVAAVHPSQPLAARYPDLETVEPDRRGQSLMPKIVSDQVSGSANAVAIGVMMSLLTAGSLALCGTMAAGYLWRRGDRLPRAVVPYLQITLPLTVALALTATLTPPWTTVLGDSPFGVGRFSAIGAVLVSAMMVAGAVYRWPWLPRTCVTITWILLLAQPGGGSIPRALPILAIAMSGFLLVRLRLVRRAACGVALA